MIHAPRSAPLRRWKSRGAALLSGLLWAALFTLPAEGLEARWDDYLDHAYVYSAADTADLRGLLGRTTAAVGRSLGEYHNETYPAGSNRANPEGEAQIRRKAIAELLLYRTGERPNGLVQSVATIETLADRLDRPENRYWYHTIQAHRALSEGNAELFVDQVLTVWLEVITPLEVPFETYKTLALTENGNAGFVRTLPHLYESIARLILLHSQTAALDGDIDSLGAIVRVLTDGRVGADPASIPPESTSKDFLDHIVERMNGSESDGGSLSYTLALVAAERAHAAARTELAAQGFSNAANEAIRDSVAAYQRAMRNANTLQGQVAIYTRALRQVGEVFATGEREGAPIRVDVPFSVERALELYEELHAAKDSTWQKHGYVEQGRDAYIAAMQGLWSEIQEASFNAASYYMNQRDSAGGALDESLVHAINHYSRYLHAYDRYAGDPTGESLPASATFGAYVASRGIGDGVLFFAGGDASKEQLGEAISRYADALGYFPFDRELWSTLAVALQRSGRESDFLAVAKPIADRMVHSRHLDRWIQNRSARAETLGHFRRAFENDRSLVYFGFADASKIDALEAEFAKLETERREIGAQLASARGERDALTERRAAAHRQAAAESGETESAAPPVVTGAPPGLESHAIAQLGLDLERLASSSEEVDARIEAISQSLPIFKATLGQEDLLWHLSSDRNHPVHGLLRRLAEETESRNTAAHPANPESIQSSRPTWPATLRWMGGNPE